jgi:hypothetical protein
MRKLYFLLPVLFAILVATVFAFLMLHAGSRGATSSYLLFNYGEVFSPLNILAMAVAAAAVLSVFFLLARAGKEVAVRLLIASFIGMGSLSTLFIGRLVFVLSGSESQLLLVVLAAVAFTGMFGAFLVLIDMASREARNWLFVVSSGAFGAFLGVLVPTVPTIGILAVLSAADTILILSNQVQKMLGDAKYGELIMSVSFSADDWGIGVGDLLCYSMIAANTSLYFGAYAGGLSMLFLLAGAFLTMKLAEKHTRVPGLPIAVALGLLPSITLLLTP